MTPSTRVCLRGNRISGSPARVIRPSGDEPAKPVAMVSIAPARLPCRCSFHAGASNAAEPRSSIAHLRRTAERAQQGTVRAPGASFRSRKTRTQTLVAESQSGTVTTASEEAAWRRRQVRASSCEVLHRGGPDTGTRLCRERTGLALNLGREEAQEFRGLQLGYCRPTAVHWHAMRYLRLVPCPVRSKSGDLAPAGVTSCMEPSVTCKPFR